MVRPPSTRFIVIVAMKRARRATVLFSIYENPKVTKKGCVGQWGQDKALHRATYSFMMVSTCVKVVKRGEQHSLQAAGRGDAHSQRQRKLNGVLSMMLALNDDFENRCETGISDDP